MWDPRIAKVVGETVLAAELPLVNGGARPRAPSPIHEKAPLRRMDGGGPEWRERIASSQAILRSWAPGELTGCGPPPKAISGTTVEPPLAEL